ncbi:nucleoside 2-deoxyribosyltransferase domain-containing protein [Actinophytocola sp.]|uniref:nucleoside 2-deoxyribosyltransferase domain-containing protein n=1 Tax=Actinophytocola sp. TaxID=1872138 RepID=UPI002ED67FB0
MSAAAGRSPHHAPAEPRRTQPERLYYEAPTYYNPQPADAPAVFLGGGITGCPRWHDRAIELLMSAPDPVVILNPNRANFPIHDEHASMQQVTWEHHHLHLPGVTTLMWFPACDPAITVQPIAMLELGGALEGRRRLVVGADDGYPRRADVRMQCQVYRPGLVVYSTLEDVVQIVLDSVAAQRRGA